LTFVGRAGGLFFEKNPLGIEVSVNSRIENAVAIGFYGNAALAAAFAASLEG